MKEKSSPDLRFVRTEFEVWRVRRIGRKLIPETLWAAALALLDRYPLNLVSRALRLSPKQLRIGNAALRTTRSHCSGPFLNSHHENSLRLSC